jgi:hypothetical protein
VAIRKPVAVRLLLRTILLGRAHQRNHDSGKKQLVSRLSGQDDRFRKEVTMKKLGLGLFLAVAAFAFLISPAVAADAPARSAADRAFIAALAAARGATSPVPVARRPPAGGVGEKSLCTAEANCAFGGTVSCQGNSSCSAVDGNCSWGEVGHVTCDGNTYWCGGSCCPENFCSHEFQCYQSCWPCNYNYTCNWNGCYDDCECQWSTCPP